MPVGEFIVSISRNFFIWYYAAYDLMLIGLFLLETYIIFKSKKMVNDIISIEPLINNASLFKIKKPLCKKQEEYKKKFQIFEQHFRKFKEKEFLELYVYSAWDVPNHSDSFDRFINYSANIAGFFLVLILAPYFALAKFITRSKTPKGFITNSIIVQKINFKKIKQAKEFIREIKEIEKVHYKFIDNLRGSSLKEFNEQLI